MNMQQMLMMLPDLQPEELAFLQDLTRNMSEKDQEQFLFMYRSKRKDKTTMLLLAAIGFLGVAGIHRIISGDIVLGILYLFTLGFCFVGTIIDIININQITNDFNRKQASETAQIMGMFRQ
jgi:TM2 domain-containing membrane protein YozV